MIFNELDFSGAPTIIIPKAFQHLWRGMYEPTEGKECDIELETGEKFILNEEMDFNNPKTDYDKICSFTNETVKLIPLSEEGVGLYLYSEAGVIHWDAAQRVFIHIHTIDDEKGALEDLKSLDHLTWKEAVTWYCHDDIVTLMNAAYHGGEELFEGDYLEIEIGKGTYQIKEAQLETVNCNLVLYKLEK